MKSSLIRFLLLSSSFLTLTNVTKQRNFSFK